MAYYLGKDVGVIIHTCSASGMAVTTANAINVTDTSPDIPKRATDIDFNVGGGIISNLTGVDLGIGTNDEDISFMGTNTPLKAEIRKETTVSLTKKKDTPTFDVLFSGDTSDNVGRWGLTTAGAIRDGLTEPDVNIGFRLYVQLKNASEIFVVRNAQMTGHTVSLNADGTQEETIEFASQVNPMIFAASTSAGLNTETDAGDL